MRSTTIVDITIYAVRNFINYPISIYAKSVQFALTFLIPYAFVNYFPSTVLLGKEASFGIPALAFGTPVLGIVLFLLSIHVFYFGVRRYESTGT